MVVFPNAKINIGLNIVAKRSDGYHDIESVMVPVMWRDILEITPSETDQTTLVVTGRAIYCTPEQNIVMRAYNALKQLVDIPAVDIHLRKVIPDGAGLGGGSADASFTLMVLNDLFQLGFTKEALAQVASGIGADCPFFIYNSPMLATGTGTTLKPFDMSSLRDRSIVIVKPGIYVSTREAYAGTKPNRPTHELTTSLSEDISTWKDTVVNDFEASFSNKYKTFSAIKNKLYNSDALYASMSGSGSAMYGIFDNDRMAEEAAKYFKDMAVYIGRF
ncbi:MAG: 4-(cytidine 5'-diphospho)-2-C-methyl-D-erythritol kinase [Bacteroides sp.]|nr:4-(cytidine 5'-diphospho)-2-C-methyl-D-erythritol kinase [Bacteroides sp.]